MKPNTLYKYRPANENTLKIFSDKKLWAPTLDKLNDPFDGHIIFNQELKEQEYIEIIHAISKEDGFSPEKVQDLISAVIDENGKFRDGVLKTIHKGFNTSRDSHMEFGIVCLSEHNDNVLMWAHYCSEHKGLCIGFDMTELNRREPDGCLKMKYQSEYPRVTLADVFLTGQDYSLKTIWTKSSEWAYEDEWRYVVEKGNAASDLPGPINEIIFGLNTEKEFEEKVRDLTRGGNITFKRAVLAESSYKLIIQ